MSEFERELSRFERLLTLELSNAEIDAAKSGAARRLSKDLKLHGFRPGKAPRPVVEAAVGSERLRTEAIEDLIPKKLVEVLEQENLSPAISPSLEKVDDIEGGVTAEVRVTLWPQLDELPNFQDRKIEIIPPDLSEQELEANIDRMRSQFASLETADRPAADGDFVSIDISAADGDAVVEETTATELLYEVGSGMLIEGVDDYLRGTVAGDEVAFEGPLPVGFGDRAGNGVRFSIKINEVKARLLPDLDDEWVSEVTEFETVEELRNELSGRLAATKKRAVADEFRQKALDALVDETSIELPEGLVGAEMDDIFHRFVHRLKESDIEINDYLNATGITQEQLIDDLRQQAVRGLRTRMVLEAVARQEGIQVQPEELAATIDAVARSSQDPEGVHKAFKQGSRALSLASDILRNKALEVIIAGARPVDSDGNPVDLGITADQGPEDETGVEVEAEVIDGPEGDESYRPGEPVFEAEIIGEEA